MKSSEVKFLATFLLALGGCHGPLETDPSHEPPLKPTDLYVTSISRNALQLSWNGSWQTYTTYMIRRGIDSLSLFLIDSTDYSITRFTDSSLDPSASYFYRVDAVRAGVIAPSNIAHVAYVPSNQVLRTLPADQAINYLAISIDGSYLVTCGAETKFNIWRTSDWSLLQPTNTEGYTVRRITITRDSKSVITEQFSSVTQISRIKIHAISDGSVIATIPLDSMFATVSSLAVTPDGAKLAEADDRGRLRLWSLADGRLFGILDTLSYNNSCCSGWDLAMGPTANILVACSYRSLKVWNLDRNVVTFELSGSFYSPFFNQDGSILEVTANNVATYFRTIDWKILYTLPKSSPCVAFSPDGNTQIIGDGNRVIIARAIDGSPIRTFACHTDVVQSIAFFPDGQSFATASQDRSARIWSLSLADRWTIIF